MINITTVLQHQLKVGSSRSLFYRLVSKGMLAGKCYIASKVKKRTKIYFNQGTLFGFLIGHVVPKSDSFLLLCLWREVMAYRCFFYL